MSDIFSTEPGIAQYETAQNTPYLQILTIETPRSEPDEADLST
jgi:hypothetical protein